MVRHYDERVWSGINGPEARARKQFFLIVALQDSGCVIVYSRIFVGSTDAERIVVCTVFYATWIHMREAHIGTRTCVGLRWCVWVTS